MRGKKCELHPRLNKWSQNTVVYQQCDDDIGESKGAINQPGKYNEIHYTHF